MGLVGFLFWRSPVSLTFGVAPGLAILALAVLSLKGWRSGKSSLPFILAQGGIVDFLNILIIPIITARLSNIDAYRNISSWTW
jgi:hypothetical protein